MPVRPSVAVHSAGLYATAECSAWNLLSLAISRLLRRAALFLWMTPLLATRSNVLIACLTASIASGVDPSVMTCSARRTDDRASVRCGLLRRRWRSETRIRFFADFELANALYPFPANHGTHNSKIDGTLCRLTGQWYQKSPGLLKVRGSKARSALADSFA